MADRVGPRVVVASLAALLAALSAHEGRAAEPAPMAEPAGAIEPPDSLDAPSTAPSPASARVHRLHRSLHALHDRALTDRAAPPLAAALGAMLDDALAALPAGAGGEPRMRAALVSRALSGGDPEALRAALDAAGPSLDPALAGALRLHLARSPSAADALAGTLATMPRESVALAHLVLGSLRNGGEGRAHLERAALLAPGTLIEEAALRRRLAHPPPDDLDQRGEEARTWSMAATAYLHRFPRSPHRARMMPIIARGLAARAGAIDAGAVAAILDAAPPLALPLAREAVLAGAAAMAEAALARASDGPRARAYRGAVRMSGLAHGGAVPGGSDPTEAGDLPGGAPTEGGDLPERDRAIAAARASIAASIAAPARPAAQRTAIPGRPVPTNAAAVPGPMPVREPIRTPGADAIARPDLVPGLNEALARARATLERAR